MSEEQIQADLKNIILRLSELRDWIESGDNKREMNHRDTETRFKDVDSRLRALEIQIPSLISISLEIKETSREIGKIKEGQAKIAGGLALLVLLLECFTHLLK